MNKKFEQFDDSALSEYLEAICKMERWADMRGNDSIYEFQRIRLAIETEMEERYQNDLLERMVGE